MTAKPVGLVACWPERSYGSVLQAYSLEAAVRRLGVTCQTVNFLGQSVCAKDSGRLLGTLKAPVAGLKKLFHGLSDGFLDATSPEAQLDISIRGKAFDGFLSGHLHLSPSCSSVDELAELAEGYSAIVVGGGALWNASRIGAGYYTLGWVRDGIRKVAYSTSFGEGGVPSRLAKDATRFLSRFDSLALGCEADCAIAGKLCGRPVRSVVDPVLLFSGEQWMDVQQREPLIRGKYIFCFFEGNSPMDFIQEAKTLTGLKIVALQPRLKSCPDGFADESPCNAGPAEYLNYIRNANYVFTDSFYCVAFSILYKKQFSFFMCGCGADAQTVNLLSKVGLENRMADAKASAADVLAHDERFDGVDAKIADLRMSSQSYLEEALAGF